MPGLIDLHKLSHDEIIDLYRLNLGRWGGPNLYFCNYAQGTTPLQWNNQTFSPWSFEASGFELQGRGQAPEPKLIVSNLFGEISALCRQYRDLNRCELTRYQVFVSDIYPASSLTVKPPEFWRIDRKTQETSQAVTFALDNTLNVEGTRIPGRKLLANNCNWLAMGGFKGIYCQYTGAATTCNGLLSTCRSYGNAARYGGAPGVDNQRQA